jgi:hypothetical protein
MLLVIIIIIIIIIIYFPSGTVIHYLTQFIRCYYITWALRKLGTVGYLS